MYCGAAFAGSRGAALSLLFFCRRFLFQIKRKCRNAGSVYRLIMVCSEGRNQLSTIQPYYNFVSAAPMTDSRKGCPYDVRSLNFVRIFKRRTKFAPTVCKKHFSEDFMPLSRQRCVEGAAPYKYASIKLYGICGRMIFAPYSALIHYSLLLISLSEAKQTPQSRLTPSRLPCRGD